MDDPVYGVNLIQNGSFEDVTYTNSGHSRGRHHHNHHHNAELTGWQTSDGPGPDVKSSSWWTKSAAGRRHVELDVAVLVIRTLQSSRKYRHQAQVPSRFHSNILLRLTAALIPMVSKSSGMVSSLIRLLEMAVVLSIGKHSHTNLKALAIQHA